MWRLRDYNDAALTGSDAVIIPPNASVLVYVGPVAVSVRVDSL